METGEGNESHDNLCRKGVCAWPVPTGGLWSHDPYFAPSIRIVALWHYGIVALWHCDIMATLLRDEVYDFDYSQTRRKQKYR